jgi:hypothetical protein
LGYAILRDAPEGWDTVVLELSRAHGKNGVGEFLHEITCPGRAPILPDDSLYEATFRLDELLRRYGGTLQRAIYRLRRDSNRWKYEVEFEYFNPAAPPIPQAPKRDR